MGVSHTVRGLLRRLPGRQAVRTIAFRTGAIRWWWRYRHLIDGSYTEAPPPVIKHDPHREQLWSHFESVHASSLIEIGCADGANLVLFAERAPRVALSGVDINPHALAIAEQRVRDAGGTAGTFRHGSAEHVPAPDASADVALSDAVFMYLPQAQAVAALREMRRVARRAMLLHTFVDDTLAASAVVGGNWVHPLSALLRLAVPGATVARERSKNTGGQWALYGELFVVTW